MIILLGSFLIVAIVFLVIAFLASFVIKKIRNIPIHQKSIPYECGELPHPEPPFPIKPLFLVPLIVFIVFEGEILLLFPWGKILGEQKSLFLVSVGVVFIVVLVLPLILFFKWDVIRWRRKMSYINKELNNVPEELYLKLNKKYENR